MPPDQAGATGPVPSSYPYPAAPRHAARQRRFALRAHERYLIALLARYDGPLRAGWEAELARVRAALAA